MTSWLVQNAVFVVPLAACVAVAGRLLRPRPAVCHALWLIVLVKLLIPPLPFWNSQWLDQFVAQSTTFARQSTTDEGMTIAQQVTSPESTANARITDVIVVQPPAVSAEPYGSVSPLAISPPNYDASIVQSDALADNAEDRRVSSATVWTWTRELFFFVWAVGILIAAVCHMRHARRLRRVLKSSAPAPPSFCAEVALLCAKLEIHAPQMRICKGLPCPMVLALPRATLLWPAHLEDRLDTAGVRAVLLHELAHLKRRDHLAAWIEVAVACLWWWHPIVWWARRELRAYAELACDAWVVAQLPDERSRYAKALVDVCEFISLAKPASAPAVGMARGNRRCFERRLHMILRQPIAARMPFFTWIAIVAVAIFVMPGFSTGHDGGEVADDFQPARPSKAKPLPAASDQPTDAAAAIDSAADESAARPTNVDASDDTAAPPRPSIAAESATNQRYNKRFSEVHNLLREVRGKGRSLTSEEKSRVLQVMRIGAQKVRDARGRDDAIVNELYAQILGRRPLAFELNHGLDKLRSENFVVDGIVKQLLSSNEFVDGQHPQPATVPPSLPLEPYRTKQARAQTLLRVVYDMPRDKSEALARFLKEQVEDGPVDVRVAETGLVVTAEANIQRTIVGIVSLMLGEPITLDLGDIPQIGYPMNPPVYQQSGQYGPPAYLAPPSSARSPQPGDYSVQGYATPAGKMLVPRTVVEPGTTTPRTVFEERVYDDEPKTFEPSTPRRTPSSAKETQQPDYKTELPSRP